MNYSYWAIVIGLLLIVTAISSSWMERLPLSTAMLYLAVGYAIGPAGINLLMVDLYRNAPLLEHITEASLLISLFSAGLKLGLPLADRRWLLPVRLATFGMLLTALFIAALSAAWLNLPYIGALLLAAILAPTDPVLAAGVQVADSSDRDRLRFSLTGEGGLNDGTALPLLILAFNLFTFDHTQAWAWHWLLVDVLWSLAAGIAIGGILGKCIGMLVVHLRVRQQEAIGLDEFLALGLIALAYGAATIAHASGFLAVFAAGTMLRHSRKEPTAETLVTFLEGETRGREAARKLATHPTHAATFMMKAVRGFNEQLEHIGEVAVVLIVGALLPAVSLNSKLAIFILLLFLVIRPLAMWLSLWRAPVSNDQRVLVSWFGIRGIGSIYYLLFAINHRLPASLLTPIAAIVLMTVTCSIIVHGISVTPFMQIYAVRRGKR
ncbi:MAG TPA: cation:proton antiporter [Spongiibacteraceae bacterium]|nr:cation:proton antiporter [Spongiibacteraceae bacterium]